MAKKPDDEHNAKLPDFDTLIDINNEDPEALTELRQRLSDEFVDKTSAVLIFYRFPRINPGKETNPINPTSANAQCLTVTERS